MLSNHLVDDIASMRPTSFAEMPMTGMGFSIGGAVDINPARTRMMGSKGDFGWGGIANTYFWIDRKTGMLTPLDGQRSSPVNTSSSGSQFLSQKILGSFRRKWLEVGRVRN